MTRFLYKEGQILAYAERTQAAAMLVFSPGAEPRGFLR